jgi:FkbM family methyltransferase
LSFNFTFGRWLMRIRPAPLAVVAKRVFRVRRTSLKTAEGTFWVDPASFFGQELAIHGIYDPATLAVLKSVLRSGDTFIDIGANEGYFSVIAAPLVGPKGRVIVVEPQARLAPVLARNFELNGCRQATIVNTVVSDHIGRGEIFLTPDVNSGASGMAARTRYPLQTQRVATTTLRDLFETSRISGRVVIKMDIEGWEHEAILGSPLLFQEGRITALVLEHHGSLIAGRGLDAAAVPQFLTRCGYRLLPSGDGMAWVGPGRHA